MNLLITSASAIAEVDLSLHLYGRIWQISLKVARICFSCGHRWPGMLSVLEIYSECLNHYLMETVKCRSVVLCVVCYLWQDKTNTVVPMSVHWPWIIHLWWNSRRWSHVPDPISVHPHFIQLTSCGTGFVFWKRRAVCGAWSKSGSILTDFYMFMLDLHWCYPEWHLALFVLINHWSWHSSIFPVRRWEGSRSEAWASNAEQMKCCSLHQSFVEPDTAWSLPIAFWHLWVPQGLWPCFCVDKDRKIVCSTGFSHSWWLS